jgi:hypothetical protein
VGTTVTPSSADNRATVDVEAPGARQVGHVERHHHRQAKTLQTEHQAQLTLQLGGIDHATIRSGAFRPAGWPVSTSQVTCSSGECGVRL